jgi:predicted Holliday junction resolvase-like endonuclease
MNELLKDFQELRKILCVCPCCNKIVRVSDMKLKSKAKGTRTWLDDYQEKARKMDNKEETFEEKEKELRDAATEAGRKEGEKILKRLLVPELKARKINPQDVKPISNPVDYVVFKGMTKKDDIDSILFLSKKSPYPQLTKARSQIQEVVKKKKYGWQVARIDAKGNVVVEE